MVIRCLPNPNLSFFSFTQSQTVLGKKKMFNSFAKELRIAMPVFDGKHVQGNLGGLSEIFNFFITVIRSFLSMHRTPSRTSGRGSSVIRKIVIKGFEPPLIVENGKYIKNWTDGLRDRLRQEALKLAKLAKQSVQQSLSVPSSNISGTFLEVQESENQWLNWEWSRQDGETPNMQTDNFFAMNDEPWFSVF
jgi:hypothetical protein